MWQAYSKHCLHFIETLVVEKKLYTSTLLDLSTNFFFFISFFHKFDCWKYLFYFTYHWHSNFTKLLIIQLILFKHSYPAPSILYIETKAAIVSIKSGHCTGYSTYYLAIQLVNCLASLFICYSFLIPQPFEKVKYQIFFF